MEEGLTSASNRHRPYVALPCVTIMHLKGRVKEQDINRVIGTKGRDRNKVSRIGRYI